MSERLKSEDIAAYVDGELSAAEARDIEAILEIDPHASAEVQRLREINSLLKAAHSEMLNEPVPLALASQVQQTLTLAETRMAETRMAETADLGAQGPVGQGWRQWGLQAVAASLLAVVLSFPAGFYAAELRQEAVLAEMATVREADQLAMATALTEALEKRLSGVAVDWHNPASGSRGAVTPVRTFRNADGSWCREYLEEATIEGALDKRRAIACRESDGQWHTRILDMTES